MEEPNASAVSPLGSGDSLMSRYLLTEELTSTHPWAFRWLATDRILRRNVEVHLLLGPNVEDAIDAARAGRGLGRGRRGGPDHAGPHSR